MNSNREEGGLGSTEKGKVASIVSRLDHKVSKGRQQDAAKHVLCVYRPWV